ncbi:roadblock/LC7 domain-containing protein [Paracidovorax anthurii]|uniref:Roadblock/LAMTOR2 domain-containing protein n=1 Tax=Paracidovorax anthurii TaxID=78229 RepID=A0A328YPW3_9BURK|nr:roadblock/LC7 domain-containing protein [Paracidovorax anthurii]RAR76061.1 hypothetical protein AX018_10558 [Paracidovorax anthurii]
MNSKALTVIPPERAQAARQVLDGVVATSGGVRMALISTLDGFEVASLAAGGEPQVRRLAAMAGSLMAMARAVGREIDHPGCRRLTFETDAGLAVFQAIGGPFPCILCLVLEKDAVFGRALWTAAEVARQLGHDG